MKKPGKSVIQQWVHWMANLMVAESQSLPLARTVALTCVQPDRQPQMYASKPEASVNAELQGTIRH